MYFIEDPEELEGKEIALLYAPTFANAISIVTKDKGILTLRQESDDDGFSSEIDIYHKTRARNHALQSKPLQNKLDEKGIITKAEFEELQKEVNEEHRRHKEKEEQKRREYQERKDREEYERLKKKFEEEGVQ